MRKITPRSFLLTGIIILLAFILFMYAGEYAGYKKQTAQAEDRRAVVEMVQHINRFQVANNDLIYYSKPLLINKHPEEEIKYLNANQQANLQLDSLKTLCGSIYVPCDDITRLDSLYRQHHLLTDSLVNFGKKGLLDLAAEQLVSYRNDYFRKSIQLQCEEIVRHATEDARIFHTQEDEAYKSKYKFLVILVLQALLFIGYLIWRQRLQLIKRDTIIASYRMYENYTDGVIIIDARLHYAFANQTAEKLFSIEGRKLRGVEMFDMLSAIGGDEHAQWISESFQKRTTASVDLQLGQDKIWYRVNLFPAENSFSIYIKNIAELKQAEEDVKKSKRFYEFISKTNEIILHAKKPEEIYTQICEVAVDAGKFIFAWIGFQDPSTKAIVPAFWSEKHADYLSQIKMSALDIPEGNGPSGKAFRSGKYYYCNDIGNDEAMKLWRSAALEHGFASSISLPIFSENQVLAIFTIYAPTAFFFTEEEIRLLEGVTYNITHAIHNFNTEIKRRAAEDQLHKVNKAIEQSSASVVITDVAGNIEYVNPAFTKLTGYSFDEVKGQNPRVLKTGYTTENEYQHLWGNIMQHQEWEGEFLNKKKNGETYWEYAVISPITDENDVITHFVAVKENITERKKLEEEQDKLLKLIESTTAYIFTLDLKQNFTYANNAVREAFEIGNEDITKYNASFFRGEAAEKMLDEVVAAIRTTGKWIGETSYRSKNGKEIPVMQVFILHKNKTGRPTHISGTGIDISRVKEVEKELLRLNDELREFSKHIQYIRETEKNKIAKEVHDELGQGLASIKFDVSWIRKHLNDDKAVLEKKTDELLIAITGKLEAFRRIYSSVNSSMLEELGLHASVSYLIDLFKKSTGINIRFVSNVEGQNIASPVALSVYRIIEESLSNIQLYAIAKTASVSLLKQAGSLIVAIEDDGRGFDINMANMKQHYGILEMRERVYALNGEFNINSIPGSGTFISIYIPL